MRQNNDKEISRLPDWESRLRVSAEAIHAAKLTYRTPSDAISLHLGYPDPKAFPARELAQATTAILNEQSVTGLQYCEEQGDAVLRRAIANTYTSDRKPVTERNIIITQGTTDALEILPQLFLSPNDVVLMEAPTYLWAIRSFQLRHIKMIGIPTDDEGVCTDQLRQRLVELSAKQTTPKFFYVMPDFQNPSGHSMSLARRNDLLSIAREFGLLIIEDSPYLELRYEESRVPTLFELDSHGLVLLAGSFSKTIAPGIRLGWIVGERELIGRLVRMKQTGACTLLSRVVASYIQTPAYESNLNLSRNIYHKKCNSMADCLLRYCPEDVVWKKPQGGFYYWLHVPNRIDVRDIAEIAASRGLLFLNGSDFFCDKTRSNAMRLSFSYESEEGISRGVSILGDLLKKSVRRNSTA
jgi:2-aminoadipate transaminase